MACMQHKEDILEENKLTENERKKEFLMGYQKSKQKVERLELQLMEIRLNKISPSVINDGMPHGSSVGDLSDYMVKLEQISQEIIAARYERICEFQRIRQQIEAVKDEKEKDLLTYRYIRGMKWEDICVKMSHSWQHVHRIHAKALKNFKTCD